MFPNGIDATGNDFYNHFNFYTFISIIIKLSRSKSGVFRVLVGECLRKLLVRFKNEIYHWKALDSEMVIGYSKSKIKAAFYF